VAGPWNLGKWSAPVGWIAIVWVILICVLFVLPPAYPITALTFNYTIVAVAVVVGGATIWWFASAKKWFTGPRQNLIEKAAHGEQTLPIE
jgi:undecaprenyl pyrophosphate phosphatase UppP